MKQWTNDDGVWIHNSGARVAYLPKRAGKMRKGWYFAYGPSAACGPYTTAAGAKRACERDMDRLDELAAEEGLGLMLDHAMLALMPVAGNA